MSIDVQTAVVVAAIDTLLRAVKHAAVQYYERCQQQHCLCGATRYQPAITTAF
jgi:hypothetical protein